MLTTIVRRSLWDNPRITLWTLATLATCVALVVTFTTIAFDVGAAMTHTMRSLGANAVAYVGTTTNVDWEPLSTELASDDMMLLSLERGLLQGEPIAVVFGDPGSLSRMTPYWRVDGRRPDTGSEECMIGRKLADHFNLSLGSQVGLELVGAGTHTFQVAGIFESGDDDEDRIFSGAAAPAGEAVPYALLSIAGGESEINRIATDRNVRAAGISVRPLRQIVQGEETVLQKVTLLSALAVAVVVILASLGVMASVRARVLERRKEIALMQTLGATQRAIAQLMIAEGAAIGAVAGVIGIALGAVVARGIVRNVFGVTIGPHLSAVGMGLLTAVLVSTGASLVGLWRTQRILPAVALRNE